MASNDRAVAVRDTAPVSPGHTLIVPRRHVERWAELALREREAMFELADRVMAELASFTVPPAGYNLGLNLGVAAGQTVAHVALHVIPRQRGDVDDPRGGVRHVVPWRGNPLRPAISALVSGEAEPFLDVVRAHLARATEVAIVTAAVDDGGLDLLEDDVRRARSRGTRVRLLVGGAAGPALERVRRRLADWVQASVASRAEGGVGGSVEARIVPPGASGTGPFQLRAWCFEGPRLAVAFVGGSDLSRCGLLEGVVWNLRLERMHDPRAYREIAEGFERWWAVAAPVEAWPAAAGAQLVAGEAGAGPAKVVERMAPPAPRLLSALEETALAALGRSRREGRGRALVVLPPGLDSMSLVARDVAALGQILGRQPRVLVVTRKAFRLEQAAIALRRHFCDMRSAWLPASDSGGGADTVFAALTAVTQACSRLERHAERFDYAVLDELGWEESEEVRRVLARLHPGFVVGVVTALDPVVQAQIAGVFDDHVAFQARAEDAIAAGLLAPFSYVGLADPLDYRGLPGRGLKLDPGVLSSRLVAEEARLERLWEAWRERPGRRTLAICGPREHAEVVRAWLAARGVMVVAATSPPEIDEAFAALSRGALQAVCVESLPEETVRLPLVDRLVVLWPGSSPRGYLENLVKTLARAAGRDAVTILDFLGNHCLFLDRLRMVAGLGGGSVAVRRLVTEGAPPQCPAGCSVEIAAAARELLRSCLPEQGDVLRQRYSDLRFSSELRPTAGCVFRLGWRPTLLRAPHPSWFESLAAGGELGRAEQRALATARDWLREIETLPTPTSLEMVVLDVLLDAGALPGSIGLDELIARCQARALRQPETRHDLELALGGRGRTPKQVEAYRTYWREGPLAAWLARGWFRQEGERFVWSVSAAGPPAAALAAMTREIVDLRLAELEARRRLAGWGSAFECPVLSKRGTAILRLPPVSQRPAGIGGEFDARVPDGTLWRFRFGTEACQVAWQLGKARNMLPELLRGWFGARLDEPGSRVRVRFERSVDGWRAAPAGEAPALQAQPVWIPCFSSLSTAAVAISARRAQRASEDERVQLPLAEDEADCFAVRVAPEARSAVGANLPEGGYLVMRPVSEAARHALEGRVVLLDLGRPGGYELRRLESSASPAGTPGDGEPVTGVAAPPRILALLERVVEPS